jgi:transposase InsO family protein
MPEEPRVRLHANARSSPHIRRLLVNRVVQEGWPVGLAAKAVGLSRKAARKWIERFRTEGEAGLLDRSSAPRSIPHRTSKQVVSRVLALRHKRLVAWAIAEQLGMPRSTIGAILRRHGLGRLLALDPKVPVIRYERENPGELIHLDTKKLARIKGVGHRIHGDRRRMSRGIGWEFAHLAIDDHTRLSYVEVLPDEGGETTASFLQRAVGFFGRHKIRVERMLTDNGSGYRSNAVNAVCHQAGIRHYWTKPYTPRTNGKAERLVQTLLREWAYRRAYRSSKQRCVALKTYVRHYNHRRPHAALGYKPPIVRLRNWHQPA